MGGEGGVGVLGDAEEAVQPSTRRVFSVFDVPNVYQVPLLLLQQRFHFAIQQRVWGDASRNGANVLLVIQLSSSDPGKS